MSTSLSLTLWHRAVQVDADGDKPASTKMELHKPTEQAFKENRFKWFQLKQEKDGRRGQVMKSNRFPDDVPAPSPPTGFEIRVASLLPTAPVAMPEEQREGWWSVSSQALLAQGMLAECGKEHAKLAETWQAPPDGPGAGALSLAKKMGLKRVQAPCVRSAVQDGAKAQEFAREKLDGRLDDIMPALDAQVLASYMSIVTCWQRPAGAASLACGDGELLLPVQAVAKSQDWPGDVFFVGTGEDDLLVVVLSGHVPAEKVAELVSAAEQLDPSPYDAVQLPAGRSRGVLVDSGLALTHRTAEAEEKTDAAAALVCFDLALGPGEDTPGVLLADSAPQRVAVVQRPLTLALCHQDLDEVGATLAVLHG